MPSAPAGPLHLRRSPDHNASLKGGGVHTISYPLIPAAEPDEPVILVAAYALLPEAAAAGGSEPWTALVGFRANAAASRTVAVAIGERTYLTQIALPESGPAPPGTAVAIDGERVLFLRGAAWAFGVPTSARVAAAGAASDGSLRSPMPGRVVSVPVRAGQAVTRGQILIAIEAMKMEHALLAPFDGVVAELRAVEGDQVAENALLARVTSVGIPP